MITRVTTDASVVSHTEVVHEQLESATAILLERHLAGFHGLNCKQNFNVDSHQLATTVCFTEQSSCGLGALPAPIMCFSITDTHGAHVGSVNSSDGRRRPSAWVSRSQLTIRRRCLLTDRTDTLETMHLFFRSRVIPLPQLQEIPNVQERVDRHWHRQTLRPPR